MEEHFEAEREISGSLKEFMLYFVGLGRGPHLRVKLDDLLEEMPHEKDDVVSDLEYLEEEGYVGTFSDSIYPTEVKGFNEILREAGFEELNETHYAVSEKGLEHVECLGLDSYEESLRYVFNQ